jgi:hypothetical protein
MWWWKVAAAVDTAQIALANAMAHNLDDQRPLFALQDKLTQAQAILLDIFRAKGLAGAGATKAPDVPTTSPQPSVGSPPAPVIFYGKAPLVDTNGLNTSNAQPPPPPPPVIFYGKVPPAPRVSVPVVSPPLAAPPPDDGLDAPVVISAPVSSASEAPSAALAPGGESPT